ncbi:hypothetical protein L596_020009 [Steinernema carpocapsae]|uniref:Uncharacterized protein n=1 Tax=Steinernema carpocapsae TaxID=34508 RepID=A0A4U5MS94_STECR|nr:hypothetical protein L596_020009 [Steinernema carpocapsae]
MIVLLCLGGITCNLFYDLIHRNGFPYQNVYLTVDLIAIIFTKVALLSLCIRYHNGLIPFLGMMCFGVVSMILTLVLTIPLDNFSGSSRHMEWLATLIALSICIWFTRIVHLCYLHLKKQNRVIMSLREEA